MNAVNDTLSIIAAIVGAWALTGVLWVLLGYAGHFVDAQRAGARRFGLARYARAFAGELVSSFLTWFAYPLGVARNRRPLCHAPGGGPPIVLVHGYMMNRSSLGRLRRWLERRGYTNVRCLDPRPLWADLDRQAARVAEDIRRISAACGGARVYGIGHSQGGLLLRVCAVRYPDLPLAKVITIGSPHRGTRIARLSPTQNAVQMRVGSPYLEGLGEPAAAPLVSIYSPLDNIVFPAETQKVGKALEVEPIGHHTLVMTPKIFEIVEAELREEQG